MGILTVGIVTYPFNFEGRKRHERAKIGIRKLKEFVDTLIVVPNQKLLDVASDDMSVLDAFRLLVDNVFYQAIKGIVEPITKVGLISIDFSDVRTVIRNGGYAFIGSGKASGKNKGIVAARKAINSPFLKDVQLEKASYVLIHIRGGVDLTLDEVYEAVRLVEERTKRDNTNFFFAVNIEEEIEDSVEITVIATGFDEEETLI